ncbi:class I SAM-dependent methyltransferase [Desulfovibrio sp. OttesenSCG-928-A18]|nr:class I SAM-dependent methyltransferase [Desulfovibrio sp. OttesenSCG-928-A18]
MRSNRGKQDNSMDFYEVLSRYYDGIFPVGEEDMAFLTRLVRGCGPILDLGCGTGNKTEFFALDAAGDNRSVTAIDSDKAMIEQARNAHARSNIRYETMDMQDIDLRLKPASFDAVLCLGNTLVHLTAQDEIRALLGKVHALLTERGRLLIQILNYDRILTREQYSLPLLESHEALFTRRYIWKEGEMRFVTSLQVKESGQTFSNDIPLVPLRKAELDAQLELAGFRSRTYYGSFSGEAYSDDSFVSIVCCEP